MSFQNFPGREQDHWECHKDLMGFFNEGKEGCWEVSFIRLAVEEELAESLRTTSTWQKKAGEQLKEKLGAAS